MAKNKSGKFWRRNEKEVLKKLGLEPVPGSGAGEIHKEDGENDYILCQLKSTEAQAIKISRLDIEKLEYHAELVNKIPVFAIQFLNGPILLAVTPGELGNISAYLSDALWERKQTEVIEIPRQKRRKSQKASEKTMDEILEDAKEELIREEAEEEDELLQAFSKRSKRKSNEKEKSKWRK